MKTVAIVSRQRLTGVTNGSSAYLLALAHAIRDAGMTVTLVQPSPSIMGRTPIANASDAMSVFSHHYIRGVMIVGHHYISLNPATYYHAARGIISGLARKLGFRNNVFKDRPLPYSVSIAWSDRDRRYCRKFLKDADVVLADYIFQTEAFQAAPPHARTAVIMHDLFSSRETISEIGSGREAVASLSPDTEKALLSTASAVIAIQRSEADWVQAHVPSVTTILAPIAAQPVARPQTGRESILLFVGSNTVPNIVGIRWFFDHVWPKIVSRHPSATVNVVGSVSRSISSPAQGVRLLGMIETLDEVYAEAGVVISPVLAGSGLKIKLIEAMARGKAIVATAVTLQGVEEECGDAVMIANDADHFAAAVLFLMEEEANRHVLAAKALRAVEAYFSPSVCYAELIAWLKDS